jgi:hypothetical protein
MFFINNQKDFYCCYQLLATPAQLILDEECSYFSAKLHPLIEDVNTRIPPIMKYIYLMGIRNVVGVGLP